MVEHHEQRDTPRDEHWSQVLRMRKAKGADLPLACGNEFSLIGQVRGKENGECHLRDFAGLETDRAELHPNGASAAGVIPKTGHEREKKKAKKLAAAAAAAEASAASGKRVRVKE